MPQRRRPAKGLRDVTNVVFLIQGQLDTWLHDRDSNLVRWAEVGARRFRFHGTPLKISGYFAGMMEHNPAAWVFTSQRWRSAMIFPRFASGSDCTTAQTRRWISPYNFRQNTLLYLPPDMPAPGASEYAQALNGVITEVISASRGRAFCLFTSHAMMNRVHRQLCATMDWPLLLQGQAPKSELLKRFNRRDQSVLFGTASFWEGVDVKGERLSCVIIDKLPFASPGDPVLKNRLSACEQEGNNPFMDIQIPSAVIALKQGAGRLIRSETDRGRAGVVRSEVGFQRLRRVVSR